MDRLLLTWLCLSFLLSVLQDLFAQNISVPTVLGQFPKNVELDPS